MAVHKNIKGTKRSITSLHQNDRPLYHHVAVNLFEFCRIVYGRRYSIVMVSSWSFYGIIDLLDGGQQIRRGSDLTRILRSTLITFHFLYIDQL